MKKILSINNYGLYYGAYSTTINSLRRRNRPIVVTVVARPYVN